MIFRALRGGSAAGVSSGLLRHHFGSKEGLLLACLARARAEEAHPGPGLRRLREALRRHALQGRGRHGPEQFDDFLRHRRRLAIAEALRLKVEHKQVRERLHRSHCSRRFGASDSQRRSRSCSPAMRRSSSATAARAASR